MEEIRDAIRELTDGQTSAAPAPEPSSPSSGTTGLGEDDNPFAEESAPSRARDATGKFAPKSVAKDEVSAPAEEVAAEQGAETAKPIEAAPPPSALKPPFSWKPEEREGWEKLDPRHQQAILRRERETAQALSQSDTARQFTSAMQQTLQPYMHMIAAENSDPVRAIGELFKTAAVLRTAPPMTKAQLVADLIIQHQVDPNMLDQAYSAKMQGRPAANDPMQLIMQQLDQRLAPITQQLNTFQQREQQQRQFVEQEASQTLEEFIADPANEHVMDVKDIMADFLETAAKQGFTLSLQDAYRRATLAHPTISKIMERRMLTNGAAQQTAAAQRARQASASITDSGAPSQVVGEDEGSGDVRSALTASIRQLSNRR